MCGLCAINDFPAVFFEHFALFGWQTALRVVENEAGAQGGKCCVDMDRVGVSGKVHCMHAMIREVATDPLDALEVRREAVLNHKIAAEAQDVCRIEERFFFSCDEEFFRGPFQALFDTDFVAEVVRVVVGIRKPRFGSRLMTEVGIFFPVFLHQRAIVQILEPAAPVGHRGFEDFRTHGQKDVARRHAAELAGSMEIRSRDGERVIDGGWAIDPNTAGLKLLREFVEQLIGAIDGFLRASSPLPTHVAVFRDLCFKRGLFGGDMAVICTAHDHVFEWIPLVPAVDDSLFHGLSCRSISRLQSLFDLALETVRVIDG
ncbi:hypothetical protein A8B83_19430 [Rhodobacteraceae bacterium EhC02]|nr:hypothetical protein A8B83_19430 [Rhodobacteraceae bacterium EhC02]